MSRCMTAAVALCLVRMLLLCTSQAAIYRMHMADERTLIPSNLIAHIAPGFVRAEIGILVIVGVLPPENVESK